VLNIESTINLQKVYMATNKSRDFKEKLVERGKTVAGRWSTEDGQRQHSLDRGRAVSALTLPHILPPQGHNEHTELPTPYNDMGARIMNNLANKLFLTLFPVSTPFFQFKVSDAVINQAVDSGNTGARQEIEKKLRQEEQVVQSDLEVSAIRPALYEVMRDLLITGDVLFHLPAKGAPNVYHIDQYVVRRSRNGTPLSIILKQSLDLEELEPAWVLALTEEGKIKELEDGQDRQQFEMYTEIWLDADWYREYSFIEGIPLDGTEGKYKKDESAWLALRWTGKAGENYGRSYGYEYYGMLKGLEGYHKAIREHSGIASKTIGFLSRSSRIDLNALIKAPNGSVFHGEKDELWFPEVGKYNDMRVVETMIQRYSESLSRAFLVVSTRDAERVTAEEIRLNAQELETALGGAYSLLSKTLQEPLLRREIARLRSEGKLVKFPDKTVEPKVIVGLEGLGKGSDLEKLRQVGLIVGELSQVAPAIPKLNINGTIDSVFNWVGLDPAGILYTDEEVAQNQAEEQQAQQQQFQAEQTAQLGQTMIPEAMKGMMNTEQFQQDPQASMEAVGEQINQQTQQG
jgi:hypothetical protein